MASIERLHERAIEWLERADEALVPIETHNGTCARREIGEAIAALREVDVGIYLHARRAKADTRSIFDQPTQTALQRLSDTLPNAGYYFARIAQEATDARNSDWLRREAIARGCAKRARRAIQLMRDDLQRVLLSGWPVGLLLAAAAVWAVAFQYLSAQDAQGGRVTAEVVVEHTQAKTTALAQAIRESADVTEAATALMSGLTNLLSSVPPLLAAGAALIAALQAMVRRG